MNLFMVILGICFGLLIVGIGAVALIILRGLKIEANASHDPGMKRPETAPRVRP